VKPTWRIQSLKIRHRRTDVVSPHAALLYFKPNGQQCPAQCTITDRHKVRRYFAPITGQTNIHWTIPDSSIRRLTARHTKHSERAVQQPTAPRPLLLSFQPVTCRPILFSDTNKWLRVCSDADGLSWCNDSLHRVTNAQWIPSLDNKLRQNVHNTAR